jgi:hypothetical protein
MSKLQPIKLECITPAVGSGYQESKPNPDIYVGKLVMMIPEKTLNTMTEGALITMQAKFQGVVREIIKDHSISFVREEGK